VVLLSLLLAWWVAPVVGAWLGWDWSGFTRRGGMVGGTLGLMLVAGGVVMLGGRFGVAGAVRPESVVVGLGVCVVFGVLVGLMVAVGASETGYDREEQGAVNRGALAGRFVFRWSIGQMMGLVAVTAVVFWVVARDQVLAYVGLAVVVLLAGPVMGGWLGWRRGCDPLVAEQLGATLGAAIPWTLGVGLGAFVTAGRGGMAELGGLVLIVGLCVVGWVASLVVGALIGPMVGIVLDWVARKAD
jgi:hypothetical protein